MFGYVKPYVPDLRVREYETYKAMYCGLCKSMGKHTGLISRLTLSYDMVFLAAVRTALDEIELCPCHHRCPVHMLKKEPCVCDNKALAYSSAVSALLSKGKLEDDIHDDKGFKKIKALILLPFSKIMIKKSRKYINIPEKEIALSLERISGLEKEKTTSIDNIADEFGSLLEFVFSYGLNGNEKKLASAIGKSIGRYIYVIDAIDDLKSDRKTGNYNPIIYSGISLDSATIAIDYEIDKLTKAIELLEFGKNIELGEIVKNIVYEGLPNIAKQVIKKAKSEEKIS